jgi:hypothetical protein
MPQKDFCNTIGTFRTSRAERMMSAHKDEQNIECTAAKLDRFVGFLENTLRGKQSKRPEGNDLPSGDGGTR